MKFNNLTRLLLVVLMAGLVFSGPAVIAVDTTVVVRPSQMEFWNFHIGDLLGGPGTGTGGFQIGPSTPPIGTGSVHYTTGPDDQTFVQLRNTHYEGVLLSSLTALSYDTYVSAYFNCQAPYLELSVDVDGNGFFDVDPGPDDAIFFEPCYQTGTYGTFPPGQTISAQNGGIVQLNTWKNWVALDVNNPTMGGWWSAKYGGSGGPPLTLLSNYITTLQGLGYSNPKIVNTTECRGGVRIVAGVGTPWPNFDGNADNFTIGVSGNNTKYDFECEIDGSCPAPPACPLPPQGCTVTIGFFKTHAGFTGHNPDVITALLPQTLGSGGGKSITVTTAAQAVSLLSFKGSNNVFDPSNGINKLYAQLLAAKLNIAGGADGSAVSSTIAAADAFLTTHDSTDWKNLSKSEKQMVLGWMTTLDSFNNGLIGPGHCDQ
jgi:hypothetical protein